MRGNILISTVVAGLLLGASSARAHHAFSAEFDIDRPVNLRGTITKMEWINPHAWLHLDVASPDGTPVAWMIELGPPNSLIKRGWTRDSVAVGTEVLVEGHRAKDGAYRANGGEVTFPDGTKLFAGSSGTGAPFDPDR